MQNHVQNPPEFATNCRHIIAWRVNRITPQALFGLPDVEFLGNEERPIGIRYTVEEVQTAFRKLSRRYHPDKNSEHKDLAQQVFDIVKSAHAYLLFTVETETQAPEGNLFYDYYHTDKITDTATKNDYLEGLMREGCRLQEAKQPLDLLVNTLCTFFEENPGLHSYICDHQNLFNFSTGGKPVLYIAAQWNQPKLFNLLLELGADPLRKTAFDVNAVEMAIGKKHIDILQSLAASPKFGKARVKALLENLFTDTSKRPEYVLEIYRTIFPEDFNPQQLQSIPNLIPALHHLGYLTAEEAQPLYRQAIIGHPELYRHLNETERLDKFMLIATLAQTRDPVILANIPNQKLEPGLVTALCDIWPDLESHFNPDYSIYHPDYGKPRASKLPNFQTLRTGLIISAICIAIVAATYYFWPVILLWPKIVLQTIVLPIAIVAAACGIGTLIAVPITGYEYFTKVYPETRDIRKLLIENNFFQPPEQGSADSTHTPTASFRNGRPN